MSREAMKNELLPEGSSSETEGVITKILYDEQFYHEQEEEIQDAIDSRRA